MRKLFRISSWKLAATFLAINFVLQAIIVVGIYPNISDNLQPLDVQTGLTTQSIQQFLTTIGEDGRSLYFINEAFPDILFPVFYSCAYALLLIQLIKGCRQVKSPLRYLALLPFGIALCDVVENIHILIAIHQFPELPLMLVKGLALANMGKHFLTIVVLTALAVLGCWFIVIKTSQPCKQTRR